MKSWRNQGPAVALLRLWLGLTWIYAGWDKATDTGFLSSSSPHFIGTQLTGYLDHSPIAFLLRRMIEHATLVGWFVMVSEFAIGFALLAGVALPLVALSGFAMSTSLWLSSSWSVHPYFLGSDTAYMILWLALLILLLQKGASGRGSRASAVKKLLPFVDDRRELLRMLGVGMAAVGATLLAGTRKKTILVPLTGTPITKLQDFPVGSSMKFTATDGSPALLFRTKAGVFAYSAVCTHQGCIVNYASGSHLIECPCHGAKYDPAHGAKVVAGPAPTPLAKISVRISGSNIVQG